MPVIADLRHGADLNGLEGLKDLMLVGRKGTLATHAAIQALGIPAQPWHALLDRADCATEGEVLSTFDGDRRILAAILPEACSRHNPPSRAWAIPDLVRELDGKGEAAVVVLVDDPAHAFASALAVGRAFSLFSAASGERTRRIVHLRVLGPDGPVQDPRIPDAVSAAREAARLADMPTMDLHSDAFVLAAREVAARTGAEIEVIQGEALREQGFGGLWGVGRAASHPPALVALRYAPEGARRTVAWVGKGIVYDTGGLSIKSSTSMPGMKGDMAGAAAVLSAFEAAVRLGVDYGVVAVLCIAENAVGPEATRPDDVLIMRSGRTVEVNNTDAEGRLVLADGLHWVSSRYKPDLAVDLATLTGAALVATGKVHAAVYANSEALERATVAAGLRAGEPVHPVLYAPELHGAELSSVFADMRNSVKDRMNAQVSCAAHFIERHLPDGAGAWVHVDMAGPSGDDKGRATGYGVGLLLELGAAGA